jgi:hypothetical protein
MKDLNTIWLKKLINMSNFIYIPKTIKMSSLKSNRFSLNPKDYRCLTETTSNCKEKINILQTNEFQGKEISSENYLNISNYRFLKTVNIGDSFITDESSIEYCVPVNDRIPQKGDILIVKDGGSDGLGESCLYEKDNINGTDSISAGILCLRFPEEIKYYILGMLKNPHFKSFVSFNTPQGSTIRHSKKIALTYSITFPDNKIYLNDKDIQNFVSDLVRNIIDKETKIKEKNSKIDRLIFKELENNQNEANFNYKFPRITSILEENRLNSNLFSKKYKDNEYKILNYNNGFTFIDRSKVSPGRTPKDYFYTEKKLSNTFDWVTPKNMHKRQLLFHTYLYTESTPNTRSGSIILTGIRYVGNGTIVGKGEVVYTNQNTLVINYSDNFEEQVVLFLFLTSNIGKKLQFARRVTGTVPILYKDELIKIPIPNFNTDIKKKLFKEYYNDYLINHNLCYKCYLENELIRNKELGIFQLNQEVISLKNKLNILTDKILKNEEINLAEYV